MPVAHGATTTQCQTLQHVQVVTGRSQLHHTNICSNALLPVSSGATAACMMLDAGIAGVRLGQAFHQGRRTHTATLQHAPTTTPPVPVPTTCLTGHWTDAVGRFVNGTHSAVGNLPAVPHWMHAADTCILRDAAWPLATHASNVSRCACSMQPLPCSASPQTLCTAACSTLPCMPCGSKNSHHVAQALLVLHQPDR
jgi:hypothetical protein